jgi:signal transduction histidine kinase
MLPSYLWVPGVGKAATALTAPDERATRASSNSTVGEALIRLPPAARLILETAPDAQVVTDRRGHIVFINPPAELLFGYLGHELVGAPLERLVPKLVGLRSDGSEFPAELSLTPLETDEGLLTVATVREREPSERHKVAEERLRLAQAQEAVRLRDDFLSIAAHELRTPLTALQLQLDGLVQSLRAIDPAVRQAYARVQTRLEKAVRNTSRLTDLVNTLLDLSRIMGGRLQLRLEVTDLAALVREVAQDFCEPERGAAVEVEAPETLEAVCDRFRFEQILINMLSNATKYGQGRPVEVRLSADTQRVRLAVRDHGIGIAAEDRERIFQKFERAVAARNYGGMGLGLYISRYLAEAHGGSMTVDATLGEGATFIVQLPRNPAPTG